MNDFNRIAPLYDWLSRFVFWGNVQEAQLPFLNTIRSGDRVLIVGGGTGYILTKINQKDVKIDFIEPASSMIQLSELRKTSISVKFHQLTFQSFDTNAKYDVIVCPFFLDLFETAELNTILTKIKSVLKPNGHLIVADFEISNGRVWQKYLSSIMHFFFRLTAGLQSQKLKDIHEATLHCDFQKKDERQYFGNFIFSRLYQKV